MQAREHAEKIALAACERENMQLLDATVALKKIGIEKDSHGNRLFLRYFNFEFSETGEERYAGTLVMRASTLHYLLMDMPEKTTIDISTKNSSGSGTFKYDASHRFKHDLTKGDLSKNGLSRNDLTQKDLSQNDLSQKK